MTDLSFKEESVQEQVESVLHLPLVWSVLPPQPSGLAASTVPMVGTPFDPSHLCCLYLGIMGGKKFSPT